MSKKAAEDFNQAEKGKLDEVTLEIYEAKVRYLTEKLSRAKEKIEVLSKENDAFAKNQVKFATDKQDSIDFLTIGVRKNEEKILSLEAKIHDLEDEKRQMELKAISDLEKAQMEWKLELEQVQNQSRGYKAELDQLSDFKGRKEDLENSLKRALTMLEVKEKEYKDIIHNMERKVLQDKNQMKKEMLQKVNEAVANFRRVADQQMAETTKRAIRENMAITSQLKKMSAKTLDLIADNETLTAKVNKLKTSNTLLAESERELAKKNQANQRVIKMLVERLKESDEMLELAFETSQMSGKKNQESTSDKDHAAELEQETIELQQRLANESIMNRYALKKATRKEMLQEENYQLLNEMDNLREFYVRIAALMGLDGSENISSDQVVEVVEGLVVKLQSMDALNEHSRKQDSKVRHDKVKGIRTAELSAVIAAIPSSSVPEPMDDDENGLRFKHGDPTPESEVKLPCRFFAKVEWMITKQRQGKVTPESTTASNASTTTAPSSSDSTAVDDQDLCGICFDEPKVYGLLHKSIDDELIDQFHFQYCLQECPCCRKPSSFIVPSNVFPKTDSDAKEMIITRHELFSGDDCLYGHLDENGERVTNVQRPAPLRRPGFRHTHGDRLANETIARGLMFLRQLFPENYGGPYIDHDEVDFDDYDDDDDEFSYTDDDDYEDDDEEWEDEDDLEEVS
ncbi:hypothetical protein HDU76_002486 [Blyttiomyces sp. JEL0837]|nr:hypothetical protein HDU76_002486 [Blyttiomyces sp. JEL0837]